MIVLNKKLDFFLIKFPIIFPLFYAYFLFSFPNLENVIVITAIFLLAEPHFGATWPFFINRTNKNYIYKNKINLIFFPILLIIFCLLGFFLFRSTFLLIFFAANIYHVTRQSFGILKLYALKKENINFYSYILYFFNILFFFIGVIRFYTPIVNENDILLLNLIILALFLITFVFSFLKTKKFEENLILSTGVLIFYPICFVENPIHAIIMGVTMHYTQYIALTYKVTHKRLFENKFQKINFLKNYNLKFIIFILFYSTIMTFVSLMGQQADILLKNLIIIAITSQMLHFYIDSQLWKFSEQHNRDNVLKFLRE